MRGLREVAVTRHQAGLPLAPIQAREQNGMATPLTGATNILGLVNSTIELPTMPEVVTRLRLPN